MVTEKDKYRAQFYMVAGFALMSPLGKLIIDLRTINFNDIGLTFSLCVVIYVFLFLCGIVFINKGLSFLED